MTAPLTASERDVLLLLARAAIAERLFADGALAGAVDALSITPALQVMRACFVTLTIPDEGGAFRLRGCIGSTEARHPAHEAVVIAAVEAAFSDPRFAPVTREEFPALVLSVSLLTPMLPAASADAVVVGRDGVMLACDGRQALFLPEVAGDHGWTREELLGQLARKAGLPAAAWRRSNLFTFQSERFGENPNEAARIPRS